MSKINLRKESLRNCREGFLESYLRYTDYLETPKDFNRWTAISLLATALGRKVWVRKGDMKLYPNLYVVLVGPSAIGKGIALGAGRELLTVALQGAISVCAQKITTEALINFLLKVYENPKIKRCETFICVPEFATFIGKCKNDPTLLHTLTHYYDSLERDEYTTLARGVETLHEICINMLAGSTPEWIKNSLPEDAIGGGFLSRLILVNRFDGIRRKPFHTMLPEELECKDNCREDLIQINRLSGEFMWDKLAMDYFSEWYCNALDEEREQASSNMEGYYGRKAAFVQKIAMISSAMYSDNRMIQMEDLNFALRMLKDNEKYAELVVRNMAQSEEGAKLDKVRMIIKQHGSVRKSELLHRVAYLGLFANQLNEVLTALEEMGDITIDISNPRSPMFRWVSEREKLEKDRKRLELLNAKKIIIQGK